MIRRIDIFRHLIRRTESSSELSAKEGIESMCALTPAEKDNLALMYEGDKARDATSKIRGFLFQDYLTINCLLNDKVEYVCSEYLEDVDVFYEDGTFEFIQVKYYPKTSPDMAEISTDLYYQYLRLQILNSSLTAKPKLCIHRKPQPKFPELDDMKTYTGLGENLPKTRPALPDPQGFLRTDIYPLKKDPQKKALFAKMAAEDSLAKFLTVLSISEEDEITVYRNKLMTALSNAYPNPAPNGNQENWSLILLGIAISYIQRRYTLVDPDFDQLRMKKRNSMTILQNLPGQRQIARSQPIWWAASPMYMRIFSGIIIWMTHRPKC